MRAPSFISGREMQKKEDRVLIKKAAVSVLEHGKVPIFRKIDREFAL